MTIILIALVAIALFILFLSILSRTPAGTPVAKIADRVVYDWSKPQTIFALMFYATFVYLVLKGVPVPDMLKSIVDFLMGFFFGQKIKTAVKGSADENKEP
jgi:hypothetical protein